MSILRTEIKKSLLLKMARQLVGSGKESNRTEMLTRSYYKSKDLGDFNQYYDEACKELLSEIRRLAWPPENGNQVQG